ncbi:MAG: carboxylesterase family protein [Bacteroidaceae bacterium]|nr:carboxylesterase family protein [Bacteroidaceae bacterium]
MKKLFYSLLVMAMASCCGVKECPVLTIEGGQVQGVTADIKDVFVFKGIPYAAPPIRDLRWKAPQPVVPWEGVMKCDRFANPSYQHIQYKGGYYTEWGYGDEAPFSEDCLYLNVWTKKPGQTNAKLPVAVWIHGGGYREGFGTEPEFDSQEWAAKDVVIVTINYRLGVFGFLTHPELSAESEHGVSGNYGILDQIESLKWVKKNIAQFGGDPDNVMIFGQSAGGGSVRTLCESPLARGLFHKAVIMSANGLSVPRQGGAMGGMGMGMGGMRGGFPGGFPGFGQGGSREEPARIAAYKAPEAPENLNALQRAEFNTKVIMDWAGYNTLQKMRAADTEVMHSVATIYNNATGNRGSITGMPIVDGYVSRESFDEAALDGSLANVPYMIGFTMNDMGNMTAGIQAFCENRQEKGNKAWAYEFARPLPDDGSHPEVTQRLKGAFHSSDLWYVFKSLKHCWRPWTKGDWDLSEKMLTAWTNFAKYSDPNGPDGGEWTPCTKENPNFMIFKLDANDNEASEMGQTVTELGY